MFGASLLGVALSHLPLTVAEAKKNKKKRKCHPDGIRCGTRCCAAGQRCAQLSPAKMGRKRKKQQKSVCVDTPTLPPSPPAPPAPPASPAPPAPPAPPSPRCVNLPCTPVGDACYLSQWGTPGSDEAQFSFPDGIALASDGVVYVADAFNNRIQSFAASGDFLDILGEVGSGDGQFRIPEGVAVAPSGAIYVPDRDNNRIQYFDADGEHQGQWGGAGSDDGKFVLPSDIAIAPDGTVYVTDTGNERIQYFSATGTFLGK